jgi:hypothetical protein
MDVRAFITKWGRSTRSERSAAQEHFFDLCDLVGHAHPGNLDAKGLSFTLEKRVKKAGGGRGFADAWKAGFFAWEYKQKGADLNAAFNQLLQYSGDLGNPPLLVASDMDRIEIRTCFTGYPTETYSVALADLDRPEKLDILRRVFHDFESFRPEKDIVWITKEAAKQMADLAPLVRARHPDPTRIAHFFDRLVFCLFAQNVGLLPGQVFTRVVEKFATRNADHITKDIGDLFKAMAGGGDFFGETIPRFDGDLFDDSPPLELTAMELEEVWKAGSLNWSQIDPSIFGTIFETLMHESERSQQGAHYTGYEDIATLVEPVVMAPLLRDWASVRERAESLLPVVLDPHEGPDLFQAAAAPAAAPKQKARRAEAQGLIDAFLKRLRAVRVLDPACGSGNFLYVALRKLKDLEYQVLVFCRRHDLPEFPLEVGPHQLLGIEKNEYAHDLAQMTVWIGMIQWHKANGFDYDRDPILQPLHTIENRDAILDLSKPDFPREPNWPEADFIVGNPPFLGGKKLRTELGDADVDRIFALWRDRVKPEADLCCYWFEKARRQIETGKCRRAGLLATQGIRGGANRKTLDRIKQTGDIFFAESDRPWVIDGANVHVSMIGFDDGREKARTLDGTAVAIINSNLTSIADITQARRLAENACIGFMGDTKGGGFDIAERLALGFMEQPNPDGSPNSDVLTPWANGLDITKRNRNNWIIDFYGKPRLQEACLYSEPFAHLKAANQGKRESSRSIIKEWWLHERARGDMRAAMIGLPRFLATATVSKHRMFVWLESPTLADHQLIAFARSDDYFFGVLHSRAHELWALRLGTRLETRPRYTPTTCFETFPFPEPTTAQHAAISAAAKKLDKLRSNWLNPPEWVREEVLEFPGTVDGPWGRYVVEPDARGVGTVRYPRLVPRNAYVFDLARRTLTNLYNERPTWLDLAHRALDEAVFAAYGWDPSLPDEALLAALLDLNLQRAGAGPAAEPVANDDQD